VPAVILTTTEVAQELGVTPEAVRKLVQRGVLRPLVPGARPLRFALLDVAEVQVARLGRSERERLDTLAEALTCGRR
jgi:excisionase family DNA binding protein